MENTPYLCIGCLRCVRACVDLKGVEALGYVVRNGKFITGHGSNSTEKGGCKFCGTCVEVCPTGALVDKGISFAEREKQLVPCRSACPVGMNIPLYVDYISRGQLILL